MLSHCGYDYGYYDIADDKVTYTSNGINDMGSPYKNSYDVWEAPVYDRSSNNLKIYNFDPFSEYTDTGNNVNSIAGAANLDSDSSKEIIYTYSTGSTGNELRYYDPDTGENEPLGIDTFGIAHLPVAGEVDSCLDPMIGTYQQDPNSLNIEKASFWNYDSSGTYMNERTGCWYDNVDEDSTLDRGDPSVFTCYKDSSQNNGYYGAFSDKALFCNSLDDSWFSGHGGSSMPAVEYYAPRHSLPYGNTDWARFGGYDNKKMISLHQIEMKYDGGSSDSLCENCHDASTWDDKNMTGLTGYQNSNPDNFMDAWIDGNATGASNTGVADDATPNDRDTGWVNSSGVFDGGLYGNCKTGLKWQPTTDPNTGEKEWLCSNALPWNQEMYIPKPDSDGSSTTSGIMIFPYNFQNSHEDSYYLAKQDLEGTGQTLDSMRVVCWNDESNPGRSTFDSSTNDEWFAKKITNLPVNPSDPVAVKGDLDVQGNGFICRWEYTDSGGNDEVICDGTTVDYHYNTVDQVESYLTGSGGVTDQQMSHLKDSKMTSNEWTNMVDDWQSSAGYSQSTLDSSNIDGQLKTGCD